MPRFKDHAICIRDLDWSESSQVVVLLTQQQGKVRGLAKGSKRQSPSSVQRFSGGIELLTAGQVVATTRPSRELAAITEWDLQQDYFPLRRDFRGQRVAMYAADVCNALLADGDPHPGMYAALGALLDELIKGGSRSGPNRPHPHPLPPPERGEGARQQTRDMALLRFQWAVLVDAGYRPELGRDVRAGGDLGAAAAYSFDPVAGGLTTDPGLADWRVRAATVRTLRAVAAGEAMEDAESVRRANRLLCVYLRSILDKQLPTMGVVLGEW
jgi:DNA repair protein RecO (recombination protein O)